MAGQPSVASAGSAAILVVDDDAAVAWALSQALTRAGYRVTVAADAASARRKLAGIDLVITDVRMPGQSGLDLLADLRSSHPQLPVIIATAHGTVDTAVAAVARGAVDYLPKPLDLHRTLDVVARALGDQPLAAQAMPKAVLADLVGQSPAIQEVHRRVAAAVAAGKAPVPPHVVLVGGPGTGKSLVADLIRRHAPGAAATGAGHVVDGSLGYRPLAGAAQGILILRQPHLLNPSDQHALAGDLQAQGGPCPRRILSLLPDLPERLGMRNDLQDAIAGLTIRLPDLADRLGDVPDLVRHLLAVIAQRLGRPVAITDEALAGLHHRRWPGNVRELRQVLTEAAILATGGIIAPEHLGVAPAHDPLPALGSAVTQATDLLLRLHPGEVHARLLDAVEGAALRSALAHTEGNQLKTAELLGLNRVTVKKRMDQLGITRG